MSLKNKKYFTEKERLAARRAANKRYEVANPERHKALRAARQKRYRRQRRNNKLKRSFGIGLEDYNRMFQEQNGKCAICKTHQSELTKALSVDHDHKTGKVRGLLCYRCNLLIGHACDEVDTLKGAIEYLK
jgi:Autographiviridae endonuclease VII